MRSVLLILSCLLLWASCSRQPVTTEQQAEPQEDQRAKTLLQGIWVEAETEEVAFRVQGDTIVYPDTISQPAFFRIISDSLEISGRRYAIEKQSEHIFTFRNQNGDLVELVKSEDPLHALAFQHRKPQVISYNSVVNRDSVIQYNGERYHWYVTINPTKYKVVATSYNDEGVGVDNVYYDNIIHISLFQGARRIYSNDFKKQMYVELIPNQFLNQSILSNIEFDHVDAKGFHFYATLCMPDGASCYMVDVTISRDGKQTMSLLEY